MKGKTKLREVFRLKFEHHLSERKIAQSCNISCSTVKVLNTAAAKGHKKAIQTLL
ncbi:sigma-70 family RNA polymerase sigma factor [Salinisphaera sp. G21_0]|uniref:sigma-70 family RNA polymerase sigma factor n=1 Tax=Salinisphaera sp. G21_0 TaxID=2821094 RepID=UPI001AD9C46B|nr:sigma-70 family RNA polymerase sigma factor [Salinisphaera sp. G21_0]MBO9483465.1 sigma-70 family RNA polymerase sigma factor [Salinisphaera sp. G21_0]